VSASQKLSPGVQSSFKPIHNTPSAFFKSVSATLTLGLLQGCPSLAQSLPSRVPEPEPHLGKPVFRLGERNKACHVRPGAIMTRSDANWPCRNRSDNQHVVTPVTWFRSPEPTE